MLAQLNHYFIISLEYIFYFDLFLLVKLFIYNRFIQGRHQLLINYPVIGRMRYLLDILRDPLRQYFGEKTFYESRDKIDWVYKAGRYIPHFLSYSVSQPFRGSRIMLKHSNTVINDIAKDPKQTGSKIMGAKVSADITYYHGVEKGIRTMLSVIGIAKVDMLSKENLTYKNNNGEIFFDIDKYFHNKLHI